MDERSKGRLAIARRSVSSSVILLIVNVKLMVDKIV